MVMEVLLQDCCIQHHVLGSILCALYIKLAMYLYYITVRVNGWFWKFNKILSISRNLPIKLIQTLFLLTASKIIANMKIEIPLSISKFMSVIEMNFWNFTVEGFEAEHMQCNSIREIP